MGSTDQTVMAITRNGLGDIFMFDSYESADEHPIVQYGDVICVGSEDFTRCFNRLDINSLLLRLGDVDLRMDCLVTMKETGYENMLRRHLSRIWSLMAEKSVQPPNDPAEICDLIRRDRQLSKKERKMTKATTKPAETDAAAKSAETNAAGEAPKKAPVPREPKVSNDATITLLADADGKVYGPDHNPKRAGSASAQRFALYKTGMTVAEFMEKGGSRADVTHDMGKNFIKVDVPAKTEEAPGDAA